ncbi:MAG: HEAT repeat domain-containing protein [Blastocatellia bacterium]|nr:HEAT repeat domain-containing protein [Blastocatellia bacterium]
MTGNGNNPEVKITTPPVKRIRASGPILILAILFVVASFLTWYLTWFGRGLSDAEITKYLSDYNHPRHVQHALLQVQERIERRDTMAAQWYPQIVALAGNPETELRLTAAWVMGSDNTSEEFHNTLKKLLADPQPIVRRNAALALVRFNDPSSRSELLAMLTPFILTASVNGTLESSLLKAAPVSRGTLLARIRQPNNEVAALRSPLSGSIHSIMITTGATVTTGQPVLTIKSDEQSVWEALRALAVVGTPDDLQVIADYASGTATSSDRIKQQATLTASAIKSRMNTNEKSITQ